VSVVLVTGGNKGIGRATARRLAELGHTVYIGARDPGRGRAAAGELGVRFLRLDVTDDDSVAAAVAELGRAEGHLDVLVNNAGTAEGDPKPEDATAEDMRRIYDVNVFGVVRVIHAFLPLLRAAGTPSIVNVSSGLGSFGTVGDPARHESTYPTPVYGSSKAALNMLTVQYAKGLTDVRVNAVDPGLTETDLHGLSGSGIQPVDVGAEAVVRLAGLGADTPTGTLTERAGPQPW
jgi:NAD(P)-dependent dehydrogenase (short-subunit alcohol dehydrogenase family)